MENFVGIMLFVFFSWTFISYPKGVESVSFTIKNNCPNTIWPATQSGGNYPALSTTGFQLNSGATFSLDVPIPWSGRFWARSLCNSDASFSCSTGDCASGQVSCNGAGGNSPATLAEFTLGGNQGQDFYDVSLVDGFNLPLSIAPEGGNGGCPTTSCPVDVNSGCPNELAVKSPSGATTGCKSACVALNQPQYCCIGAYNTPQTCPPTNYSNYFKGLCPKAYSYAYDDSSSTFTCPTGGGYIITFCP